MTYDFQDKFDRADGHNFLFSDPDPGPWDTESTGGGGTGTIVSGVATFSLTGGQAWVLGEDVAATQKRWAQLKMRWDTKSNATQPVYYVLAVRNKAAAVEMGSVFMRAPTGEDMHWQSRWRTDAGYTAVSTIAGVSDPVAGTFYTVTMLREYSSGVDAADGKFLVFINGALVQAVLNIDDDTLADMDELRVGAGANAGAVAGRFDDAICHTVRPGVRRRRLLCGV